MRAVIRGIGSYLPKQVLSNEDLSKRVDTSDAWIQERTGIRKRHIASEGEYTSDLGYEAAKRALDDAGMRAADIDLIIVATSTPDLTFPSTATIIQEKLEMHHGAAFDIQAVCSGFIYGMHVANSLLQSGGAKRVLLIGAETFSRILDWTDRGTCVLFGDGAGAVIMEAVEDTEQGVLRTFVRSDGRHRDMLYVDGGPSRTQTVGHLRMLGNQVFKHAVTDIAQVIRDCAEQADVEMSDIDWFVPHQANQRILTAVAKRLKLRPEQVVSTVGDHANTSAASVPLAMDCAVKDGRIKRGNLVMLEAFGGGFTWGAALLRY
ncbi:3-oxoacyl-[acyl-carrier-protein] synthase 3 [Litorimonas cladophorae]|uniref:Beta-ketoacyl-[acyl-carrier-protein] synthase III n=1 Tax=Litorimonas cladophorae TaxID=1220491 RepID=A0A918KDP9_9PROT|nr:beta-ketoacyl-ACP synthase III [Litorimonas cladophorae]GGX59558.1 3-oxoacyl-[acyl-carrier-protein] synthase 3 [Litorimonas cladophorae]